MKVFISMPMKGKSAEQVKADMDKAIHDVKELYMYRLKGSNDTLEIIDSVCKEYDPNKGRGQFVRFSTKLLADADLLYVCRGWERAPGCVFEVQAATNFDLDIIFEK